MSKSALDEMTQAQVKGKKFDLAVLPIGSCEVHAMHLPFGTDAFHATMLARRAAELASERGARVLVLPTLPFGCDQNLMAYAYTVSLNPTTIMKIFDDLIGSLKQHGIRKFLLLNGHGGNTGTLEATQRELYAKYDVFVARLETWRIAEDITKAVCGPGVGEHADESETSTSLALFPDLVNMSAAIPGPTNDPRVKLLVKYGGKFSRPWHFFTNTGGDGDPTKATREQGEKIVNATVERLAAIFAELCATAHDKKFPY